MVIRKKASPLGLPTLKKNSSIDEYLMYFLNILLNRLFLIHLNCQSNYHYLSWIILVSLSLFRFFFLSVVSSHWWSLFLFLSMVSLYLLMSMGESRWHTKITEWKSSPVRNDLSIKRPARACLVMCHKVIKTKTICY